MGFIKFIAVVAGIFIVLWAVLGGVLGKPNASVAPTETQLPIPTTEPTNTNIPTKTSTFVPTSSIQPTITLPALAWNNCVSQTAEREQATLVRVVDGDTIVVAMNGTEYKVRYIGMDSPEVGSKYAQEATDYNTRLLSTGEVVMIKDVSETDRYDRLLRYVFSAGVFVNYQMVQAGYAKSGSWPPDTSCDMTIAAAMASAQKSQVGMWIVPLVVVPPATKAPLGIISTPVPASTGCPNGCTQPSAACQIKGNINAEGEKIYHMPGQAYYDKTIISPEKGERWFCTEAEAIANGWRKSKR